MDAPSPLRPELAAFVERISKAQSGPSGASAAENRAAAEIEFAERWGEGEPVAKVEDTVVDADPPVPVRIYRPERAHGTIVFIHGGGWINGSVASFDGPCRMLANRAGASVVSVEYRRAPEHPFPEGLTDCDRVLDWVLSQGRATGLDASAVFVAGESAGGNLAAVAARRARDRGVQLAGQALIYPVTDLNMGSDSYDLFANDFLLTAAGMRDCIGTYLSGGGSADDPDVSPLKVADAAGLPPMFLATAEFDPLRDEGRAYAAKLIGGGVDVVFREYRGAIHGIWLLKTITSLAETMVNDVADWIWGRLPPN